MRELLLVVDFINEIVDPAGKIASCACMVEENEVIAHANTAIAAARLKKTPVVQVKVGFSEDYIECPEHSPVFSQAKKHSALMLGTWGTEFHPQLDVASSDHVLIKHRINVYYATSLAAILDAQRIERVLICGVATSMAIESTTRELHDRGFKVVVLADACADATDAVHRASLESLARIAEIRSS